MLISDEESSITSTPDVDTIPITKNEPQSVAPAPGDKLVEQIFSKGLNSGKDPPL